jgi:hypothetical protein
MVVEARVRDGAHDRARLVGRAVVDDPELEGAECLGQHAPDGALERRRAVVGREDD